MAISDELGVKRFRLVVLLSPLVASGLAVFMIVNAEASWWPDLGFDQNVITVPLALLLTWVAVGAWVFLPVGLILSAKWMREVRSRSR